MYLTSATLAPYLIARDTLDPANLIAGSFHVQEAGRRNRNFKIFTGDGSGVFLKQAPSQTAEVQATLQREAMFHQLVATRAAFRPLAGLGYEMLDYDARRGVLTLELASLGRSLNEFFGQAGPDHVEIGRLLALHVHTLHESAPGILADHQATRHFPHRHPWILHIPRHAEAIMPSVAGGQTEVIATIRQTPALVQMLDIVAAEWCFNALSHGDMKWDNIIINGDGGTEPFDVRIVDWELADIGDAGWDVGCVIAGYLQRLILTQAGAAQMPGISLFAAPQGNLPAEIEAARKGLLAFWSTYSEGFGLQIGTQSDLARRRAMRFAAVRLLLSAFEVAGGMPASAAPIAQLIAAATAIARDPDQAALNALTDPTRH